MEIDKSIQNLLTTDFDLQVTKARVWFDKLKWDLVQTVIVIAAASSVAITSGYFFIRGVYQLAIQSLAVSDATASLLAASLGLGLVCCILLLAIRSSNNQFIKEIHNKQEKKHGLN